MHAFPACRPTSGHFVCANVAPVHAASVGLWHVSQVVGNPARTWLGFVAFWKSGRWHLVQSRAVPR